MPHLHLEQKHPCLKSPLFYLDSTYESIFIISISQKVQTDYLPIKKPPCINRCDKHTLSVNNALRTALDNAAPIANAAQAPGDVANISPDRPD